MQQIQARDKRVKDGAAPKPAPTYLDLAGKVAVVMGGSHGIGATTVRLLADNGVRLLADNGARAAVNGRDQAALEAVAAEITARQARRSGCRPTSSTLGRPIGCGRRWSASSARPGCWSPSPAGRRPPPHPPAPRGPLAGGHGHQPHLDVPHHAGVAPGDDPAGPGRHRHHVLHRRAAAGGALAASAAAKAAVVRFTRQVANELACHGVRVNCAAPGAVVTDRLARMPKQVRQQLAAHHPLGQLGMPEDVALATLFLVSDAASWLTGVTLDVAGGRVML